MTVSRRNQAPPDTAVTYVRVSTEDQARSGLGLGAQRARIGQECARREWRVVGEFADEGLSGKDMTSRPGLQAALATLERREAANLVVYKLDRLSRSVHDFSGLIERAQQRGWALTVMDLGLDMSTPAGRVTANVLVSIAQFEREMTAQRTSDALQVLRSRGVALGRPDRACDSVAARVEQAHRAGESLRGIARRLNAAGVCPPQGGQIWRHTSVAAVLRRSPTHGLAAALAPGSGVRSVASDAVGVADEVERVVVQEADAADAVVRGDGDQLVPGVVGES